MSRWGNLEFVGYPTDIKAQMKEDKRLDREAEEIEEHRRKEAIKRLDESHQRRNDMISATSRGPLSWEEAGDIVRSRNQEIHRWGASV